MWPCFIHTSAALQGCTSLQTDMIVFLLAFLTLACKYCNLDQFSKSIILFLHVTVADNDTEQCIDVMADHMESFKPDLRMLIEGKGKQVVHIKLGGEARKSQKV